MNFLKKRESLVLTTPLTFSTLALALALALKYVFIRIDFLT